jgi:hypothetical protein
MNILLFTALADRTGVAFCISRGDAHCALTGEISPTGAKVAVRLAEPGGAALHSAELPSSPLLGADRASGIAHVLAWLRGRNIRVDLVAHYVEHQGYADHILRLAPDRVSTLAEFDVCQAAVYGADAVLAADPALPQVAFFAVRPHTAVSIARAVEAACPPAPAGCPMKKKVRCDGCSSN